MELQIPDFQRVASPMLRESTSKVGDRVNKLVRDGQKQLFIIILFFQWLVIPCVHNHYKKKKGELVDGSHTYILDVRLDLHVRIDARDQILNGPPHALIRRRVVLPARRPAIVQRQQIDLFRSADLRGRPY